MNFMANSYFILQIHHAKSFKMRHITYLYFIYLSRYSLIQIQVTILLSGTDIKLQVCNLVFKKISQAEYQKVNKHPNFDVNFNVRRQLEHFEYGMNHKYLSHNPDFQ